MYVTHWEGIRCAWRVQTWTERRVQHFLLRAFVAHSIPCKKSIVVVSNVYYIVINSFVNYNVSQSAFRVTSIQNIFPNLSSIQLYHSQPKMKILYNLICVLLNLQSLKHWKLNPLACQTFCCPLKPPKIFIKLPVPPKIDQLICLPKQLHLWYRLSPSARFLQEFEGFLFDVTPWWLLDECEH